MPLRQSRGIPGQERDCEPLGSERAGDRGPNAWTNTRDDDDWLHPIHLRVGDIVIDECSITGTIATPQATPDRAAVIADLQEITAVGPGRQMTRELQHTGHDTTESIVPVGMAFSFGTLWCPVSCLQTSQISILEHQNDIRPKFWVRLGCGNAVKM